MNVRKEDFENTCKLFIDSVGNYFKVLTTLETEISVPYLKETKELELKQFTGMIGISGNKKGYVYFSADKDLLEDLINLFIGLEEPDVEDIMDMAGEISNVIAGNIRTNMGTDFVISTPLVFKGQPEELRFPNDTFVYVIPVKWKSYHALVIVGLQ